MKKRKFLCIASSFVVGCIFTLLVLAFLTFRWIKQDSPFTADTFNDYVSYLASIRIYGPLFLGKLPENPLNSVVGIGVAGQTPYPFLIFHDKDSNGIIDWIDILDRESYFCAIRDKDENGIIDFFNFGKINGPDINFIDFDMDDRFDSIILFPDQEIGASLSVFFNENWYDILRKKEKLILQKNESPIQDHHGIKIYYGDRNNPDSENSH